ncbi:hypothetical protein [Marinimicrobium sp. ABcell2]|uniref:hypothetical protein n=1 Tax=Marinimicrobium sp. ABcell2 TaxID=3069751 RepID=UPI0027AE4833|nr:hypothetical protein [Marinimicrobium sp. ABcell2]MDQ2078240.1 hypothetical protein [Marinimicrobium sp. ABcell2]
MEEFEGEELNRPFGYRLTQQVAPLDDGGNTSGTLTSGMKWGSYRDVFTAFPEVFPPLASSLSWHQSSPLSKLIATVQSEIQAETAEVSTVY